MAEILEIINHRKKSYFKSATSPSSAKFTFINRLTFANTFSLYTVEINVLSLFSSVCRRHSEISQKPKAQLEAHDRRLNFRMYDFLIAEQRPS